MTQRRRYERRFRGDLKTLRHDQVSNISHSLPKYGIEVFQYSQLEIKVIREQICLPNFNELIAKVPPPGSETKINSAGMMRIRALRSDFDRLFI